MRVALLWHMHQPPYADPRTAEPRFPWVLLHGARDYRDMVERVGRIPGMRATFNLVPSLADQIEAQGSGAALDAWVACAQTPAGALDPPMRRFVVDRFFPLPLETAIARHVRYLELHRLREDARHRRAHPAEAFSEQDLRDLQVWFLLAWCGERLGGEGVATRLLAQGRRFSETDKAELLGAMRQYLAGTLASWAEHARAGAIEVSTTPYYHPILPLLINGDAARRSDPGLSLPELPCTFPESAARHCTGAFTRHEQIFGAPPLGVWPAEGAISDEALDLLAAAGARWVASDEQVLRRSLGVAASAEAHLRPWRHGRDLTVFFRDTALSDRIGFVYARWRPEDAVSDLVARMEERARRAGDDPRAVLTLALDGENAWAYYTHGAGRFLDAFYRALAEHPYLEPVRFCDVLDATSPDTLDPLPALVPGSWVSGSFHTWIGHPPQNRAWDLLRRAHAELRRFEERPGDDPARLARARDLLMRAEASDWFWWLGPEHNSAEDAGYDAMFRDLLRAAWEALGGTPPSELDTPLAGGPAAGEEASRDLNPTMAMSAPGELSPPSATARTPITPGRPGASETN